MLVLWNNLIRTLLSVHPTTLSRQLCYLPLVSLQLLVLQTLHLLQDLQLLHHACHFLVDRLEHHDLPIVDVGCQRFQRLYLYFKPFAQRLSSIRWRCQRCLLRVVFHCLVRGRRRGAHFVKSTEHVLIYLVY